MLYDYIITNYEKDEPIFLAELPGKSREIIRQEMKRLADEGKVERLYNGVYYLSYTTILGTKGKVSLDKFIQKKFLEANGNTSGYITGMQLANMYGFTTQNPSCYEVCSNEASTKQRKVDVDGRFGPSTADSVRTFQRIFDLPASGIVDYPTWYKLSEIYVGVSKIAEYS